MNNVFVLHTMYCHPYYVVSYKVVVRLHSNNYHWSYCACKNIYNKKQIQDHLIPKKFFPLTKNSDPRNPNTHKPIELDWIEEYQWVDPPRLWEAIWIQKWSHFQLDSLFSPRPCTKVMGKKARWQPPIFVSCLLIGQNGITPLFGFSSMHKP